MAAQAKAETLVATRPGLMCSEPRALAELTLPDGSSRAASRQAHRDDAMVKQRGGCLDFSPGAQVTLVLARINTSVVTVPAPDGRGRLTFTVPNIDFRLDQASVQPAPDAAPALPETPAPPIEAPEAGSAGNETTPRVLTARDFFARLQSACPQQGWTEQQVTQAQPSPVDAVYNAMPKAQQREAQNEADIKCQDVAGQTCAADTVIGFMVRAGHLDALVQATCAEKAP